MNDTIEMMAPEPAEPDPRWAAETLRQIKSSTVRHRRSRKLVLTGGLAAWVVVGGGAVVANVGHYASTGSFEGTEGRRIEGPTAMGNGGPGPGPLAAELEAVTTKPWATNEFGMTVGEPTCGDVLAENLPDLMPTFILDHGESRSGYFRSDEFYTYAPSGELENPRVTYNVYGPDGKTLLGTRRD